MPKKLWKLIFFFQKNWRGNYWTVPFSPKNKQILGEKPYPMQ